MKTLMAGLMAMVLTGCYDKGSDSGTTVFQNSTNPVYVSGELGTINVQGTLTESRSRFTMNPDEFPLAVHISGEYIPSPGNTLQAQAEMSLYDTMSDNNPDNDILAGQLNPSPFSRARLSIDAPGSFSIMVPVSGAYSETIGPKISTLGIRLRINATGWYGTITGFRYKVVTLKGCKDTLVPDSFIRDF